MTALVSSPGVNTNNSSGELVTQEAVERSAKEIEGMIMVAKRFPRNEEACFQAVIRSCQRFTFAEDVTYDYPRGDGMVTGPSIYLARELARIWGNIAHGAKIINDTESHRTIRCFAHDFQTNTRIEADAEFAKMIYRKKGGWIKPDERDLRELTNRHAALAVRNCILHMMPSDLIAEALLEAQRTIEKGIAADPEAHTKMVLKSFLTLKVSAEDLKAFLGHEIGKATPEEVARLRSIYTSIRDGNSKWSDYMQAPEAPATPGTKPPTSAEELKQQLASEQPQPEQKTRRARKPKQVVSGETPAKAPEPAAPKPEPPKAPEPPKQPERDYTDPATEGQLIALKALMQSSPERKKVVDEKLHLWDIPQVDELNYGSVKELITLLESIRTTP